MYPASEFDYTTSHSRIASCGRLVCTEGLLRCKADCGPCLELEKRWRHGSSDANRCAKHKEVIMEEMEVSTAQARALA
eukprot:13792747-Heterocapsa_arctica.AAC.1